MKVTRVPVAARRHVQLELGDAAQLPAVDLKGAVVKVIVEAAQGTPVDVAALRQQALDAGAAHVAPIVPSYIKIAAQVLVVRGACDPESSIEAWAAHHRPPKGCDPAALFAEIS